MDTWSSLHGFVCEGCRTFRFLAGGSGGQALRLYSLYHILLTVCFLKQCKEPASCSCVTVHSLSAAVSSPPWWTMSPLKCKTKYTPRHLIWFHQSTDYSNEKTTQIVTYFAVISDCNPNCQHRSKLEHVNSCVVILKTTSGVLIICNKPCHMRLICRVGEMGQRVSSLALKVWVPKCASPASVTQTGPGDICL